MTKLDSFFLFSNRFRNEEDQKHDKNDQREEGKFKQIS